MKVQTLTFDVRGMTDRQAYFYVESLRLGLTEFAGLVRHGRSRRAVSGEWIIFCTWEDAQSLLEFRKSEAYARFALSPNVVGLHDHVESVESEVAKAEILAAA